MNFGCKTNSKDTGKKLSNSDVRRKGKINGMKRSVLCAQVLKWFSSTEFLRLTYKNVLDKYGNSKLNNGMNAIQTSAKLF